MVNAAMIFDCALIKTGKVHDFLFSIMYHLACTHFIPMRVDVHPTCWQIDNHPLPQGSLARRQTGNAREELGCVIVI